MAYTDVIILIPSHSLEDFPTDQGEVPAASLLNAFAVAWHPQILAGMPQLPRWHRADDPPAPQAGQLVFIPEVSEGWLPHGWAERARAVDAVVIDHVHDREEMLAAALSPLPPADFDAELARDFLALGTCWLQIELLTRHMRNFANIDEIRLQNRAIAAARAVVARDHETAVAHLRSSFEILLEAREKFYPVDCYLIDLLLVIPDVADEHLLRAVSGPQPINVLVNGEDLQTIGDQNPVLIRALREGVAAGRVGLVGGEQREVAVPVLPVSSWLQQMVAGHATFQALVGSTPKVWGRRRYGLFPAWPQILSKLGYVGALHVVLDDGIYPDAENTRLRWQGCDETIIDAFSRIPLAADGAGTFLRFPVRLAESMDNDHVAAVCLARWPEVKAPWLGDLARMQKYAPVLGKFVTFEQMFAASGTPGRLSSYPATDYFTPFLIQHVARREANPLSRYADHVQRRLQFDAAAWCRNMAAALQGKPVGGDAEFQAEQLLESAGPDRAESVDTAAVDARLAEVLRAWPRELAAALLGGAAEKATGLMLLNPYRFGRRVTIPWPRSAAVPAVAGCVRGVDPSPTDQSYDVTVDVPGCGFVWLSTSGAGSREESPRSGGSRRLPAVEDWLIRGERFEISFNESTGGIGQVRHPSKRENRFSQLVSFRYPRERQLPASADAPATKSQYAETRCLGQEVLRSSGAVIELATFGEIVDQLTGNVLAKFRQQTRLPRYRPVVEFDLEFSDVVLPDGDPWNQYFCVRFAWDNSAAAVTRVLLDGAHAVGGDRFETTEYIEIADDSERLTIVPHGLPCHRKTGPRMLDSLLMVAGETRRKFQFTVAIDQPYPLEAAREAAGPVFVVPTEAGFSQSVTSGWLLHLDVRNVQLVRFLEPMAMPAADPDEPAPTLSSWGFGVRLLETEGQRRPARLRLFRQPIFARKRDLRGNTLQVLTLEQDAVLCELGPYELADIEVGFA
ncbi:MAG: hypothetical protein SFV23_25300 [Planctomycetaceae bacterium]|nr:hypothetical protein [Planctomycetaceae bacterium]